MSEEPRITVQKIAHPMPVSFELLIGSGALTEAEALERGWVKPVPVHVPRLRRLRWRMEAWWYEHKPHIHLGPCDHGDCI